MDIDQPLQLLGGISPARFMKQYWQKKPLLVRNAVPPSAFPISRAQLFDLASDEDVESRLIDRRSPADWKVRSGPFARRALPPLSRKDWTVLVQGVDLHVPPAHDLLCQFRFVPDARLDDLMVSYATDEGGVGPHFDSYDVFLLQTLGQRRWRIGRQKDLSLRDDLPLKVLQNFEPQDEFVLEPGDMLYLPPRYAHDGTAIGECMTCSIGFRAPPESELVRELLQRLDDGPDEDRSDRLYQDRDQAAVSNPGAIPGALHDHAQRVIENVLRKPYALGRALGEYLTEPKPDVWFEASPGAQGFPQDSGVVLDRRTRMMYDDRHVFINGESFVAGGRDARTMRLLADQRRLSGVQARAIVGSARDLVGDWVDAGWIHAEE